MPETTKRNPQAATLRNIRALKTRVIELEKRLRELIKYINKR